MIYQITKFQTGFLLLNFIQLGNNGNLLEKGFFNLNMALEEANKLKSTL